MTEIRPDTGLAVQVEGLACRRGWRLLFAGLHFSLAAGEALAVHGANGSGKTSLLRQLAGLLPVEQGRIDVTLSTPAMHFIGHADGLKSALTVDESLGFAAAMQGAACPDPVLGDVGLAGRGWQRVGDLSAGQRRRLALAELLLAPRPLWLLDEPMTALDEEGGSLINALARDHLQAGGCIIASSHVPLAFAERRLDMGAFAPAADVGAA